MSDNHIYSSHTYLLPLLIIAGLCASVLFLTDTFTRDRIANNISEKKLEGIASVIPHPYNNSISADLITLTAPGYFGTTEAVKVYRARQNNEPTGVVILPVHARGYSGVILLAVGIHYDGTLAAVRIIEHTETKGIGDAVDQSNSDWLKNFKGRSLDNTPRDAWDIKQNNGAYDQISGATITSRGVINAVQKALEYYNANRDKLYQ